MPESDSGVVGLFAGGEGAEGVAVAGSGRGCVSLVVFFSGLATYCHGPVG